jgi:hypothetical protein
MNRCGHPGTPTALAWRSTDDIVAAAKERITRARCTMRIVIGADHAGFGSATQVMLSFS